jgi:hypothetical protein
MSFGKTPQHRPMPFGKKPLSPPSRIGKGVGGIGHCPKAHYPCVDTKNFLYPIFALPLKGLSRILLPHSLQHDEHHHGWQQQLLIRLGNIALLFHTELAFRQ